MLLLLHAIYIKSHTMHTTDSSSNDKQTCVSQLFCDVLIPYFSSENASPFLTIKTEYTAMSHLPCCSICSMKKRCRYSSMTKWPILVHAANICIFLLTPVYSFSYYLVPAVYHTFNPYRQAYIQSWPYTSSYNGLSSFPVLGLDTSMVTPLQFGLFFSFVIIPLCPECVF